MIFVFIVGAVYTTHSLSQRAYREGEISTELTQNARVLSERMTREIRQSREIVTDLPASSSEGLSHIEFEDGHSAERYRYIRYFQEDGEIKREIKAYYFTGDEAVFVPWNATPPVGEDLGETVIEEAGTVGEFVADFRVWSSGTTMTDILLSLEKRGKDFHSATGIFGRNL